MHELSIAESILAVAERHAGGRQIARVEVKVGHLRQVVPSALEFAFELLAPGVQLAIVGVPATVRCGRCGAESRPGGFPLICPCGSGDVDIVAGQELTVESLDVEEEEVAYGR